MAITDKTRKIIWGKSGNRCAICKHELVINATALDDESIIGDECHIISSRPDGPRHDASYLLEKFDAYENLILLCRVHHKMVDDQEVTYTVNILRQMKINHEIWVSQQLSDDPKPKPVKITRIKQNIPEYLIRLSTGKDILNLVLNTYSFSVGHDELKSEQEVNFIGNFLQSIQDYGDIIDDLGIGERIKFEFELTKSIDELDKLGFFVFGAREMQLFEGGYQAGPSNWPVSIIRIIRKENNAILSINPEEPKKV